ncbi:MAG: hypothetical protein NTZ08_08435, partial [Verrucomicrobia bacterium]|nr:hypothetical protein [Verrucomicrobiota bacterium]
MKKSLVFVLFCAAGFCVGYLAGVPFFKSPLRASETPLRADAGRIEEHRGEFVSLASRDHEPQAAPTTVKTT